MSHAETRSSRFLTDGLCFGVLSCLSTHLPACLLACLPTTCLLAPLVCLQGGMITQIEQEEMPRLLSEAKSDAEKSGVKLLYSSRNMSYCEFLEDYGTA